MGIPQQLTFVTLGARDLSSLRRFYRAIGWAESDGATDSFAAFDCVGGHRNLPGGGQQTLPTHGHLVTQGAGGGDTTALLVPPPCNSTLRMRSRLPGVVVMGGFGAPRDRR
jgi:hypothetical protein